MTPAEVVKVYAGIQALWPPRLVDPLTKPAAMAVASALPSETTVEHALAVVDDFFRRGSPFPPSWPEIAARWQARTAGVPDDPDVIVGRWLAEVYAEVGKGGGCFYRAMPEFSDPAIGAAVESAAGSWRQWGEATNGDTGPGGAFTRNTIPERDERFRRTAKALLLHRARTGEALPALLRAPLRLLPPAGESEEEWVAGMIAARSATPDLSMERAHDVGLTSGGG